jgi:hypothetical protein
MEGPPQWGALAELIAEYVELIPLRSARDAIALVTPASFRSDINGRFAAALS